MSNIRYYKGRFKCLLIHKGKKKALVKWLEPCNVVGSTDLGYKSVNIGDWDIINSMRLLWKNKKNENK